MSLAERMLGAYTEPIPADAAARPRRRMAVLTCMDARLDVERALDLRLGDAHVLRNAGGWVTEDVIESLALSQHGLGTREIVVLHHTGCAGAAARAPGVADEANLRAAVHDLRHAALLPRRDRVRGLLLDTVHGTVTEVVGFSSPRARPAPERGAAASAAPPAHHCAWCHRPFSPLGMSRRRRRGAYCSDLCRVGARTGRRAPP